MGWTLWPKVAGETEGGGHYGTGSSLAETQRPESFPEIYPGSSNYVLIP